MHEVLSYILLATSLYSFSSDVNRIKYEERGLEREAFNLKSRRKLMKKLDCLKRTLT